ncbi:hypothetical protein Glove_156g103 [Diversispora epigaea]|uniref:tRNA-splicing endonuclease subunit Sen15 domain-containing protein n=1 Tax=Diversispora epigaea TaxID=1348612 RepID=A0A397IUU5_9GLOM|nr:hypothetical protein Glove_156g103 [Diversispora epigaea]
MNTPASLDNISEYLDKYPQEAPCLSQVYVDLTLVKSWFEVKIKEVEALRRCVLLGKPSKKSTFEIIVFPCAAVEIWSIERMSQLFSSLSPNNFVVDDNELKSGDIDIDIYIIYIKLLLLPSLFLTRRWFIIIFTTESFSLLILVRIWMKICCWEVQINNQ